jgi:hypothetical protein
MESSIPWRCVRKVRSEGACRAVGRSWVEAPLRKIGSHQEDIGAQSRRELPQDQGANLISGAVFEFLIEKRYLRCQEPMAVH